MTTPLGIVRGMDAVEYHSIPAISATILKRLYKTSPAHVYESLAMDPTAAMEKGSALHCMVLEPEKFDSRYYQRPVLSGLKRKDGTPYSLPENTTEGKAILLKASADNDGKVGLSASDMRKLRDAAEALRFHQGSWPLIHDSEKEVSIFWEESHLGLCKARLDLLGKTCIADLKSTNCAHPRAFSWEIRPTRAANNYWIQAAWYFRGCLAVDLVRVQEFNFIAVEIEKPFGISIHSIEEAELHAAQDQIGELAAQWATCLHTSNYPGYQQMINHVTIAEADSPLILGDRE